MIVHVYFEVVAKEAHLLRRAPGFSNEPADVASHLRERMVLSEQRVEVHLLQLALPRVAPLCTLELPVVDVNFGALREGFIHYSFIAWTHVRLQVHAVGTLILKLV